MTRSVTALALVPLLVSVACRDATPITAKGDLVSYPVSPTRQAVELFIDPDQSDYRGNVRIDLQVTDRTDAFAFHAQGMELERVALVGEAGEVELTTTADGDDGRVIASAAGGVDAGDYRLEIDFSNDYETRAVGLYRAEHEGRGYLFTQFEAVDARRAFPCWDEPRFKIPWQLTLAAPEGQRVVSNMPVETERSAEGWVTRAFAESPPMPSYLVAIAAGPLDRVPIDGLSVPGYVYTVAGQARLAKLAVEVTPPLLKALERYFDRAYPYPKLDLIGVPEYWPGAMENPGLVTFDDSLLLPDPDAASVAQRRSLAAVTAHELAHMWFGDLVTMAWWDDLWLNEAFASWLGDKITHEVFPEYKLDVASVRSTEQAMIADARPSTLPVRKPVEDTSKIFEDLGLAYSKGQAVLEMVEQWIGPETFRKGIVDYVGRHAWGNAEADDLWGALSTASGRDVGAVMAGFIEQPGFPTLAVSTSEEGSITISQSRFLNHGAVALDQEWVVPVALRYSGGGEIQTKTLELDGPVARTETGTPVDWVMPNVDAAGYYRWQVQRDELLALARNAYAWMDARERIAFLGNAAALLDAGTLAGRDYLEVLSAFADDPDPEVVTQLLAGLGKVRASFVPDDQLDTFAAYVRRTLRPALDRFGVEPVADEDEAVAMFRPRLVRWLGEEGRDAQLRRHARELAESYMADPRSVEPSLVPVVLRLAALDGDRALYESYRSHFEQADTPVERQRYLGALGSFGDPEIQQEALRYSLADPVRPTEMFSIAFGLPNTEAAAETTFLFVLDNFDVISSRMPPDFRPMLVGVSGGCSRERLEAGKAFFLDPARRIDGMESQLKKVTEQVGDCLGLREREGATVAAYLSEFSAGGD